jgi:polyhydroxyalkanoate synthase subunit PhaE
MTRIKDQDVFMDWQAQRQNIMKTWLEAQQSMLQGWGSLSQSIWTNPAPDTDRAAYETTTAAWHSTMLQSIRFVTHQADETAVAVAERLFASQMGMLHLLEISTETWQVIAPLIQAGEDWSATFDHYIQQLRLTMLRSATEGLSPKGSVDQLWQAFLREGQTAILPWLSLPNPRVGLSEDPSGLLNLSSLSGNIYRNTAGTALQGINNYPPEIDKKLRLSFNAWLDMQRAAFDYNSSLAEVWVSAFERLIRELAQLAEQGEMVENVRDFLNRWSATADDVFQKTSRSEAYLRGQVTLINAIMHYRQCQRQVNEAVMQWIDLPSRSEIDESHRRIYELNKEVKSLRRELAAMKALVEQLVQSKDEKG